eukprot:Opistho-2@51072
MLKSQKKTYIILFLVVCSLKLFAQKLAKDTIKMQSLTIYANGKAESILWQSITLDEAAKKAKEAQKHILIYFTAKWCGPCLKMQQEVFPNHEVIRAVNDNYVAIKIDIDAWGSKKWTENFAIKGMPEFFILNASKQRLRHNLGALATKDFLAFLDLNNKPLNVKVLDTTHQKVRYEKWSNKMNIGVAAGTSNLSNGNYGNIFGYEVKLGYVIEKQRILFNPGASFTSIGSSGLRLNYIKVPAQVAFNVYRGSLFGLPSGYRILAAPYYARLLNNYANVKNRNDMGSAYGIGVYIGNTNGSSLEFSLKGSSGFVDILSERDKQTNRFLSASLTFNIEASY